MKINMLGLAKNSAAALTITAAASAAFAQQSYTAQFNGNTINCATLQGRSDPTPGGFTCGFVKEIDKHIPGPPLDCSGGEGDSFAAMSPAADHMDRYHGMPGLHQHVQTQMALRNTGNNNQAAVSWLENRYPGQGREFFITHYTTEALAQRLSAGHSFNESAQAIVGAYQRWGWELPGGGTGVASLERFLAENPIVQGRLVCLKQHPNTPWSTYER